MAVYTSAMIYCDEPDDVCPRRGDVFEPDVFTVREVRRLAREGGWTRPMVDGKRRDRCDECTKRLKHEPSWRKVACPTCGAGPGELCNWVGDPCSLPCGEEPGTVARPHKARVDAGRAR